MASKLTHPRPCALREELKKIDIFIYLPIIEVFDEIDHPNTISECTEKCSATIASLNELKESWENFPLVSHLRSVHPSKTKTSYLALPKPPSHATMELISYRVDFLPKPYAKRNLDCPANPSHHLHPIFCFDHSQLEIAILFHKFPDPLIKKSFSEIGNQSDPRATSQREA